MARRANGEGTLHQRKDGLWEGKCYVLLPNGGYRRRSVYGKTREEAHDKLLRLMNQAREGIPAPVLGLRLDDYLNSWLTEVAVRRVRPSTYKTYELMVRLHINPTIGRKRVDRLSAPDVRRLVNTKLDEGLAASSVRQMHAVLRSALEQAVRDDMLARNVARLVQVSNPRPAPVKPYDAKEAKRLLKAAADDRLGALWTVALGVGLRKGEALALRWTDLDLKANVVHVRRSLQRLNGRLEFVSPKTQRSQRTVPLPMVCASALRAHKNRQATERKKAGAHWQDHGLVFTTTIGTPIDPRNVNRWFDQLCERAKVRRLRVHDLRHTCASLLLAQGVPARVVMETLGHSQIAVTMDIYSHVMPATQQAAAAEIDRALGTVVVNRGRSGKAAKGKKAAPKGKGPGQGQRARRDSNPQPSDP